VSPVVYFTAALSSFRCAVAPGTTRLAWLCSQAGREGCDGSSYVVGPAMMLEEIVALGPAPRQGSAGKPRVEWVTRGHDE
jgi:hypothetical protein